VAPSAQIGEPCDQVMPPDFAEAFIETWEFAMELGAESYLCLPMVNLDKATGIACRACLPAPHLTTDGHLSACDVAPFGPRYLPAPLHVFLYGYYDKAQDVFIIDEQKASYLRGRNAQELRKGFCRGCEIVEYCAGGCLGQAVQLTDSIWIPNRWACQVTRILAKYFTPGDTQYPVLHS
jgi:uncharacterized protein